MWERWLPDFQWHPVTRLPPTGSQGGLCGNEDFKNALVEKQHDT